MEFRERVKEDDKQFLKARGGRKVITGSELINWEFPAPQDGDTWGSWTYDAKRLALTYLDRRNKNWSYEVDLEKCEIASEVLDWIAQLKGKTWITAEDIGNLVLALDDLLHLQNNIVHLREGKRFDVKKYLTSQKTLAQS